MFDFVVRRIMCVLAVAIVDSIISRFCDWPWQRAVTTGIPIIDKLTDITLLFVFPCIFELGAFVLDFVFDYIDVVKPIIDAWLDPSLADMPSHSTDAKWRQRWHRWTHGKAPWSLTEGEILMNVRRDVLRFIDRFGALLP